MSAAKRAIYFQPFHVPIANSVLATVTFLLEIRSVI